MIDTTDLIGKPFRRGAKGPNAFDCWSLVVTLAERAGRVLPADWCDRDLTRPEVRALMADEAPARTVLLDAPAEGAIAYSRRRGHVGYVLNGRVLHAARGAGVVASSFALWRLAYPDGTWHAWRG